MSTHHKGIHDKGESDCQRTRPLRGTVFSNRHHCEGVFKLLKGKSKHKIVMDIPKGGLANETYCGWQRDRHSSTSRRCHTKKQIIINNKKQHTRTSSVQYTTTRNTTVLHRRYGSALGCPATFFTVRIGCHVAETWTGFAWTDPVTR